MRNPKVQGIRMHNREESESLPSERTKKISSHRNAHNIDNGADCPMHPTDLRKVTTVRRVRIHLQHGVLQMRGDVLLVYVIIGARLCM